MAIPIRSDGPRGKGRRAIGARLLRAQCRRRMEARPESGHRRRSQGGATLELDAVLEFSGRRFSRRGIRRYRRLDRFPLDHRSDRRHPLFRSQYPPLGDAGRPGIQLGNDSRRLVRARRQPTVSPCAARGHSRTTNAYMCPTWHRSIGPLPHIPDSTSSKKQARNSNSSM